MHKLSQYVPNLEAVDAKRIYPKEYISWREDPSNFIMNGRYPIRDLWEAARVAWKEILLTPVRFLLFVIVYLCKYWKLTCKILSRSSGRKLSGCDS